HGSTLCTLHLLLHLLHLLDGLLLILLGLRRLVLLQILFALLLLVKDFLRLVLARHIVSLINFLPQFPQFFKSFAEFLELILQVLLLFGQVAGAVRAFAVFVAAGVIFGVSFLAVIYCLILACPFLVLAVAGVARLVLGIFRIAILCILLCVPLQGFCFLKKLFLLC